jgi:hopanoid biosynthesis associated RND transporter like protein HpnN
MLSAPFAQAAPAAERGRLPEARRRNSLPYKGKTARARQSGQPDANGFTPHPATVCDNGGQPTQMIRTVFRTLVEICTRWPWAVVAIALMATVASSDYSIRHFSISTDIVRLISPDLPWRQRELAFNAAFPQTTGLILAVIDAPTPENASRAASVLSDALEKRKDLFESVSALSETPFFARSAFLFLPPDELAATTGKLTQAAPLIGALAADPSLRGLAQTLAFGVAAAGQEGSLGSLADTFNKASTTIESALAGKLAAFSWQEVLSGEAPRKSELRRFLEIHPVLDFAALQPGKVASDAVRRAVTDLKLGEQYGATVRLTGSVPIADEEFATVQDGALVNTSVTIVVVLFVLWLALRSKRIILAVFLSVGVGLAITAAVGLLMVGTLNLISVAFAVLFVGLGVDFGIQFSVRYRAERHVIDTVPEALSKTAEHISEPLTLAAAATAAGFLSFVPTDYRGVSELGLIAGVGMIIAFFSSVTLLPALLTILNPPGENAPLGYARLAPVDRFMERHRMAILIVSASMVVAGLPLLKSLQFDFNPINLRNPKAESIATYLDVRSDPTAGASAIDVLAPSQDAARTIAERLRKVPEVSQVRTLESFVPADQDRKLALIRNAGGALLPALDARPGSPPTDAQNLAALKEAQQALDAAAGNHSGAGPAAAKRLAGDLGKLAAADEGVRQRAQRAFIQPLQTALNGLKQALHAGPVTEQGLPADLRDRWLTSDGRARVDVLPKGDPNNNDTVRQFASVVLAAEPTATGGPIAILQSGETIIDAFYEAGLLALLSITLLLWITLRSPRDIMLTLIPLLVAGVVTLELCVVFGLKINFANIIALPLLLGIGVAFKIYYVMAWREGQSQMLQSPLTRAVFYSAMTTATAFGSLWLSNHPGTSSMGKLLALSLACTLAAALLFQPVLLGPPRDNGNNSNNDN